MKDYRGRPVDLSAEFDTITDTSDEEGEERMLYVGDGKLETFLVDPPPSTPVMPKLVAVPVQDGGMSNPVAYKKKKPRTLEDRPRTPRQSRRKLKALP